jgi:hypothetical protein
MASYVYTAGSSAAASANIQTDKVRIATTSSPVQFTTSYPNVSGNGTVTCATNSPNVAGSGTAFTSQLGVGYWIGNATGSTVGVVKSITNNGNLILAANAAVAITGAGYKINPWGVPYSTVTANSEIIPANTTRNSIVVGQGNVVSFLNVSGATAAPFSITELGASHPDSGTTGVLTPPARGGPSK